MPSANSSNFRLTQVVPDQPAHSPWAGLSRQANFFEDDVLRTLITRGVAYVQAGVCLHLSGPAGLGKTTVALRIAESLGRSVAFMAGNQWLDASDLIGREVGQTSRTVVDKYIQSVRRTDAEVRADWKESLLTQCMRAGHTLVYDEFTRASPQANAMLLSVLEEGVLVCTDRAAKHRYIEAHPQFRIILTSNPHDYVGVNGAPDALLDRMVTLNMPAPSTKALTGILALRTGIDAAMATEIVGLVDAARGSRDQQQNSRLRSALMIARIAAHMRGEAPVASDVLAQIAEDVLHGGRRMPAPVTSQKASAG